MAVLAIFGGRTAGAAITTAKLNPGQANMPGSNFSCAAQGPGWIFVLPASQGDAFVSLWATFRRAGTVRGRVLSNQKFVNVNVASSDTIISATAQVTNGHDGSTFNVTHVCPGGGTTTTTRRPTTTSAASTTTSPKTLTTTSTTTSPKTSTTTSAKTSTTTSTTTSVPLHNPPNIFQVELRNCVNLHVAYNYFPAGTVVRWNVAQNKTVVGHGQFTTLGGGGAYHMLTQPLGVTLQPFPKGYVHFHWTINNVPFLYTAIRATGC